MKNFTVGCIPCIVSSVDGPREGARGTECLVSIEKSLEAKPKAVEGYENTEKSSKPNIIYNT